MAFWPYLVSWPGEIMHDLLILRGLDGMEKLVRGLSLSVGLEKKKLFGPEYFFTHDCNAEL